MHGLQENVPDPGIPGSGNYRYELSCKNPVSEEAKMLYQQGDILFEKATPDLRKAKRLERENGRHVLARGESTGHAHAVLDPVDVLLKDSTVFVRANAPFTVVHEEHKDLRLPAGIWQVGRVKEYDHFAEETRPVFD